MERKQIYTLVNTMSQEVLGKSDIVNEDLTGIIDLGTAIFNANAVDQAIKSLVNQIGQIYIENKRYTGNLISVLMNSWEFGSVVQKVRVEMPEAVENETWNLVDGQSYDPNVYYTTQATVKFFNSQTTFEIEKSYTDRQLKESFQNAEQLNAFLTSMQTTVENAMTIATENLIKRTINNMTAEVLHNEYSDGTYNTKSGIRAVNLLKLYNDRFQKSLTVADAIYDQDFIRYAVYIMKDYQKLLSSVSTLFNVGGKPKFTTKDRLHMVVLGMFDSAAKVYLYDANGQLRVDNITLDNYETIPYWQGSGTDLSFEKRSTIDIKTSAGNTVKTSGILAVMFDHEALGVHNYNRRTTTNYNAKAEFTNYFYKQDAGYFNDLDENFVVFFIA